MGLPVLTEALDAATGNQIEFIRHEATGYHINLLHGGTANVLRADGHVEPWGAAEYRKNGWTGHQAYLNGELITF